MLCHFTPLRSCASLLIIAVSIGVAFPRYTAAQGERPPEKRDQPVNLSHARSLTDPSASSMTQTLELDSSDPPNRRVIFEPLPQRGGGGTVIYQNISVPIESLKSSWRDDFLKGLADDVLPGGPQRTLVRYTVLTCNNLDPSLGGVPAYPSPHT